MKIESEIPLEWTAAVTEIAGRHFRDVRGEVTPEDVARKINSLAEKNESLATELRRAETGRDKQATKLTDVGKIAKRRFPWLRLGKIRRRMKRD